MNSETKPIYTWDAKPSRRNLTAADIRGLQGRAQIDADDREHRRGGGGSGGVRN